MQVPFFIGCLFLLGRALICIAANLTVNELMNRQRYSHFNHELAGYCNRFDRGLLYNCYQFWLSPAQDW